MSSFADSSRTCFVQFDSKIAYAHARDSFNRVTGSVIPIIMSGFVRTFRVVSLAETGGYIDVSLLSLFLPHSCQTLVKVLYWTVIFLLFTSCNQTYRMLSADV